MPQKSYLNLEIQLELFYNLANENREKNLLTDYLTNYKILNRTCVLGTY